MSYPSLGNVTNSQFFDELSDLHSMISNPKISNSAIVKAIKTFIRHGGDINDQENPIYSQYTIFLHAVYYSRLDVVKTLITLKANVYQNDILTNYNAIGQLCSSPYINNYSNNILLLLLNHGVSPVHRAFNHYSPLTILLNSSIVYTPYHVTLIETLITKAPQIVHAEYDIIKHPYLWTPIHHFFHAHHQPYTSEWRAIFKLLIQKTQYGNTTCTWPDYDSRQPPIFALVTTPSPCAEKILHAVKAGIRITTSNELGETMITKLLTNSRPFTSDTVTLLRFFLQCHVPTRSLNIDAIDHLFASPYQQPFNQYYMEILTLLLALPHDLTALYPIPEIFKRYSLNYPSLSHICINNTILQSTDVYQLHTTTLQRAPYLTSALFQLLSTHSYSLDLIAYLIPRGCNLGLVRQCDESLLMYLLQTYTPPHVLQALSSSSSPSSSSSSSSSQQLQQLQQPPSSLPPQPSLPQQQQKLTLCDLLYNLLQPEDKRMLNYSLKWNHTSYFNHGIFWYLLCNRSLSPHEFGQIIRLFLSSPLIDINIAKNDTVLWLSNKANIIHNIDYTLYNILLQHLVSFYDVSIETLLPRYAITNSPLALFLFNGNLALPSAYKIYQFFVDRGISLYYPYNDPHSKDNTSSNTGGTNHNIHPNNITIGNNSNTIAGNNSNSNNSNNSNSNNSNITSNNSNSNNSNITSNNSNSNNIHNNPPLINDTLGINDTTYNSIHINNTLIYSILTTILSTNPTLCASLLTTRIVLPHWISMFTTRPHNYQNKLYRQTFISAMLRPYQYVSFTTEQFSIISQLLSLDMEVIQHYTRVASSSTSSTLVTSSSAKTALTKISPASSSSSSSSASASKIDDQSPQLVPHISQLHLPDSPLSHINGSTPWVSPKISTQQFKLDVIHHLVSHTLLINLHAFLSQPVAYNIWTDEIIMILNRHVAIHHTIFTHKISSLQSQHNNISLPNMLLFVAPEMKSNLITLENKDENDDIDNNNNNNNKDQHPIIANEPYITSTGGHLVKSTSGNDHPSSTPHHRRTASLQPSLASSAASSTSKVGRGRRGKPAQSTLQRPQLTPGQSAFSLTITDEKEAIRAASAELQSTPLYHLISWILACIPRQPITPALIKLIDRAASIYHSYTANTALSTLNWKTDSSDLRCLILALSGRLSPESVAIIDIISRLDYIDIDSEDQYGQTSAHLLFALPPYTTELSHDLYNPPQPRPLLPESTPMGSSVSRNPIGHTTHIPDSPAHSKVRRQESIQHSASALSSSSSSSHIGLAPPLPVNTIPLPTTTPNIYKPDLSYRFDRNGRNGRLVCRIPEQQDRMLSHHYNTHHIRTPSDSWSSYAPATTGSYVWISGNLPQSSPSHAGGHHFGSNAGGSGGGGAGKDLSSNWTFDPGSEYRTVPHTAPPSASSLTCSTSSLDVPQLRQPLTISLPSNQAPDSSSPDLITHYPSPSPQIVEIQPSVPPPSSSPDLLSTLHTRSHVNALRTLIESGISLSKTSYTGDTLLQYILFPQNLTYNNCYSPDTIYIMQLIFDSGFNLDDFSMYDSLNNIEMKLDQIHINNNNNNNNNNNSNSGTTATLSTTGSIGDNSVSIIGDNTSDLFNTTADTSDMILHDDITHMGGRYSGHAPSTSRQIKSTNNARSGTKNPTNKGDKNASPATNNNSTKKTKTNSTNAITTSTITTATIPYHTTSNNNTSFLPSTMSNAFDSLRIENNSGPYPQYSATATAANSQSNNSGGYQPSTLRSTQSMANTSIHIIPLPQLSSIPHLSPPVNKITAIGASFDCLNSAVQTALLALVPKTLRREYNETPLETMFYLRQYGMMPITQCFLDVLYTLIKEGSLVMIPQSVLVQRQEMRRTSGIHHLSLPSPSSPSLPLTPLLEIPPHGLSIVTLFLTTFYDFDLDVVYHDFTNKIEDAIRALTNHLIVQATIAHEAATSTTPVGDSGSKRATSNLSTATKSTHGSSGGNNNNNNVNTNKSSIGGRPGSANANTTNTKQDYNKDPRRHSTHDTASQCTSGTGHSSKPMMTQLQHQMFQTLASLSATQRSLYELRQTIRKPDHADIYWLDTLVLLLRTGSNTLGFTRSMAHIIFRSRPVELQLSHHIPLHTASSLPRTSSLVSHVTASIDALKSSFNSLSLGNTQRQSTAHNNNNTTPAIQSSYATSGTANITSPSIIAVPEGSSTAITQQQSQILTTHKHSISDLNVSSIAAFPGRISTYTPQQLISHHELPIAIVESPNFRLLAPLYFNDILVNSKNALELSLRPLFVPSSSSLSVSPGATAAATLNNVNSHQPLGENALQSAVMLILTYDTFALAPNNSYRSILEALACHPNPKIADVIFGKTSSYVSFARSLQRRHNSLQEGRLPNTQRSILHTECGYYSSDNHHREDDDIDVDDDYCNGSQAIRPDELSNTPSELDNNDDIAISPPLPRRSLLVDTTQQHEYLNVFNQAFHINNPNADKSSKLSHQRYIYNLFRSLAVTDLLEQRSSEIASDPLWQKYKEEHERQQIEEIQRWENNNNNQSRPVSPYQQLTLSTASSSTTAPSSSVAHANTITHELQIDCNEPGTLIKVHSTISPSHTHGNINNHHHVDTNDQNAADRRQIIHDSQRKAQTLNFKHLTPRTLAVYRNTEDNTQDNTNEMAKGDNNNNSNNNNNNNTDTINTIANDSPSFHNHNLPPSASSSTTSSRPQQLQHQQFSKDQYKYTSNTTNNTNTSRIIQRAIPLPLPYNINWRSIDTYPNYVTQHDSIPFALPNQSPVPTNTTNATKRVSLPTNTNTTNVLVVDNNSTLPATMESDSLHISSSVESLSPSSTGLLWYLMDSAQCSADDLIPLLLHACYNPYRHDESIIALSRTNIECNDPLCLYHVPSDRYTMLSTEQQCTATTTTNNNNTHNTCNNNINNNHLSSNTSHLTGSTSANVISSAMELMLNVEELPRDISQPTSLSQQHHRHNSGDLSHLDNGLSSTPIDTVNNDNTLKTINNDNNNDRISSHYNAFSGLGHNHTSISNNILQTFNLPGNINYTQYLVQIEHYNELYMTDYTSSYCNDIIIINNPCGMLITQTNNHGETLLMHAILRRMPSSILFILISFFGLYNVIYVQRDNHGRSVLDYLLGCQISRYAPEVVNYVWYHSYQAYIKAAQQSHPQQSHPQQSHQHIHRPLIPHDFMTSVFSHLCAGLDPYTLVPTHSAPLGWSLRSDDSVEGYNSNNTLHNGGNHGGRHGVPADSQSTKHDMTHTSPPTPQNKSKINNYGTLKRNNNNNNNNEQSQTTINTTAKNTDGNDTGGESSTVNKNTTTKGKQKVAIGSGSQQPPKKRGFWSRLFCGGSKNSQNVS